MPGVASDSAGGAPDSVNGALVPYFPDSHVSAVYPLSHGLTPPISRVSLSWGRGNSLRVSLFRQGTDDEVGGKVVEVTLGKSRDGEISDAQWRKIAYGSVSPFALLQSRKNSSSTFSKMELSPSPYHLEWWEYVMEYSKDISSLLGNPKSLVAPLIEDPREVVKNGEEPTNLKAAWELMEMFYVDKLSQSWLPERLVDWLAEYDSLISVSLPTVHLKLVEFQSQISTLQVIEDDHGYWGLISSALSVGWLEIVVKLLRLHGSYQLDQLGRRETENGLVEAVAVLISKMPRMRPVMDDGKLGECFKAKPDYVKAWERWRAQITKLDSSAFWIQCYHSQTREGLKNVLQIMLGNVDVLRSATCHWIELYVSHFLYIRPFTAGLESMYSLAQKCIQLKQASNPHKLMRLMIGILGENHEVVLAECSRGFGPWMVAHSMELLSALSNEADILLHEEQESLGGISLEELHRLVYAQVLSSHALTWQIAPIYLTSCMRQGMGLLEILLLKQSVLDDQLLLKLSFSLQNLEICRLYELDGVSSRLMEISGVYHWKHGRKGSAVFWLRQAQDEVRLNRIAKQLFDSVGKSISGESFKQWEGLIELLGSEAQPAGGLDFLHKYRDFKKCLQQADSGKDAGAARQAVESLMTLMRNASTPQRFWLPILYDAVKLLSWEERPLVSVAQTNVLLNKLQELSVGRLRPDYVQPELPAQAMNHVRYALATNLGRAIVDES
ncbi:Nuclear pore complex protein NUP85 [Linum perenne]